MNKDYVNRERQPDLLDNYGIPTDPDERKRWELEQRNQHQKNLSQASSQGQQYQPQASYEENTGPIRFFRSNKAREIHVPNEDIVIHGRLAVSPEGPFIRMSDKKFRESYQFQTLLEKPVTRTNNPALRGKMVIEELTEDQYRQQYREYLREKAIREKEYATEHNNIARHDDGSIDEDDASFEIRKVNPKIIRAQGG